MGYLSFLYSDLIFGRYFSLRRTLDMTCYDLYTSFLSSGTCLWLTSLQNTYIANVLLPSANVDRRRYLTWWTSTVKQRPWKMNTTWRQRNTVFSQSDDGQWLFEDVRLPTVELRPTFCFSWSYSWYRWYSVLWAIFPRLFYTSAATFWTMLASRQQ